MKRVQLKIGSIILTLSEGLKNLFERAIATALEIYFRKNRRADIRRHAVGIERLTGLCQEQLVWQSKGPAVWQSACEYIGKNSLSVLSNRYYLRLSSHQSHRKRFTAANSLRPD